MGREFPVLVMTIGGSVLALWLYVRLGERRPRSLGAAIVHAVIAGVLLGCAPPAMSIVVGDEPSHRAALAALLGLFLPAVTYTFLASMYVLEQVQRRLYAR